MKAMAFVDYENIWTGLADRGYRLAPEDFVQLIERYAEYIDVDLRAIFLYANFDKEEFWRTQTSFEKTSVFTRHVFGKNNYANTEIRANAADSELMLEAQDILLTKPSAVDTFLLFTGDGDFFPLLRKIRASGKEVRIIGVEGKTHHILQPYCESIDVFCRFLEQEGNSGYDPAGDVVNSLRVLADLQTRLPYIASTRARVVMSEQLERSLPEIKDLIRHMLNKEIILEKEHYDSNLVIKKTKIYLLNLDNTFVQETIGDKLETLKQCYRKLI